MVKLTKIYTKTGDNGITAVANNRRVNKMHPIIDAIGAVDEANSAIGLIDTSQSMYLEEIIDLIQNDMFDLGAELSGSKTIAIKQNNVDTLEKIIDDINKNLEPLNTFVLPTGQIHFARTVVRRAERSVWWYIKNSDGVSVSDIIPQYLNRLSDLLFVIARQENKGNEKLWKPMGEE